MLKKLVLMVIAVSLAGCAAQGFKPVFDYDQSYNFLPVRTYAFVDREHLRQISPLVSDMTRSRVEQVIDNSMTKYSFQKVSPDKADVLISYYVATEDKQSLRNVPNAGPMYYGGYGYGYGCRRCYYGGMQTNSVEVRNYTEGTFVIDIIDRASDQGVWRSMVQATVRKSDTEMEREARMQQASDIMLAGFPPNTF